MSTQSVCDHCGKPVSFGRRYCSDCLGKIQERAEPKDCRFCGGKQTVQATYQMEGDYGAPYICHTCMKDQRDEYVWKKIPAHIADAVVERGEDAAIWQGQ